jgi:hypothetical protein
MNLNAYERLLASGVIAPPTSFKGENAADLGARQGEAFKQRQDNSIEPKVESAYTPSSKANGDSADVMYATSEGDDSEIESEGAQSELETPSKLMATLDTLSFLVNADSTAQTENPFPLVHDYPPAEQAASSTHDNGMVLESAPSPVDMVQIARSTHGMEVLPLVENQVDNPDLVSANKDMEDTIARLIEAESTANDNINPYPDKTYPATDGYLAAEVEVEADINPSMFGNGTQPLGGMGG